MILILLSPHKIWRLPSRLRLLTHLSSASVGGACLSASQHGSYGDGKGDDGGR